ncbi:SpoIIE family protein phosphatase [Streptomyces chromofuscus]|uniref:SpoIIE family protein phosphatase n=1 Tax=Streptomyces chromofuscus TaxID=42881 RepID=UPI00167599FF|nr:SpoIIE family protein phosphatase [Streptomyces chromofuscus]GGT03658.1 hypothetical protein GCM10010254_24990 [Streptomyces chromofuscus]
MAISESPAPHGTARLLSNSAYPALASLDASGAVIGWSDGAHRLLGHTAEEALERPAVSWLAGPVAGGQVGEAIERFRAGEPWHGELRLRHRDGRELPATVHLSPMRGSDGHRRWVVVAEDERQTPVAQTPVADLGDLMFAPLLAHSPLGVAVLGTDLRFIWTNEALTYGNAVPREERLGRRLSELFPHMEVDVLEGTMRRVLATGEPVLDFEYLGRSPVDRTRRHAWWMCFFRLEDSAGQVLGVWYMVMDITERWRARERMTLLNEASARIGSTLDMSVTTQELADVAVPRFADLVRVDLLESVLRGHEPVPGAPVGSIALRRTGRRAAPGRFDGPAGPTGETVAVPPPAVARCLRESRSVVESTVADSPVPAALDVFAPGDGVARPAPHAYLYVPVRARGITLGVVQFVRSGSPEPFDDEDVDLAEELAALAAVCVDNARRFTCERTAALTLQRSLLPRALAGGTALDVAWRYLPAGSASGVGGDWFDVIPLSGARVALVTGDVVGHGTNAAVTMGRLRTAVRTLADLDLPPEEVLAHLDDLVISLIEQESTCGTDEEGPDVSTAALGSTCLYAVYDPVARRCAMARAGHPPPVVVRPGGVAALADAPAGPPLGLGALPFEGAELDLPEGSLLALYTDGLLQNGRQDPDAALACLGEVLARPGATPEGICEEVTARLLTLPRTDDVALIVSRTRALDDDQVASWDVPADPAFVSTARDLATRRLSDWGLEELTFTTELIVSELVTNAIRYGSAPVRLRLIRQNVLICEVADASSTSPRLRHARTTDEGGRGLFLVAQLSRRWGARSLREGKTIWTEQSIGGAPAAPLVDYDALQAEL